MQGVIDALRAAHDQGVVHRVLKPSNTLVDAEGRAKVMDFGIAARLTPTPAGAAVADGLEGCIVGTPGQLSPEAAAGSAPDVFAAGLVLGELLGGQPLLVERLRWLAVAANELSDAVWQGDEDALPARLEAVAQRHGRALGAQRG